ncbi:SOS response-associated peptidase [Actinobacteria bacterium YIM 96077]|uniref:Abasic site processing protein n=1 Tax=Phytoactinopolyspora halophila TaxID=1981511 RepID=A0A329R5S3_9ACTN|nr:SOS response-associated peptidase [Phytoactinopolyspora halophila]AYY11983.1 SOS response-associated peptidase [Actinobacteria bacterium YIM 96077]RAW18782.1 SOS response-associated peptidase [Phytoactinopolyspora halophila]
MCGRYVVSQSADDLADEFGVDRIAVRERLEPDWNVAPSKQVYAVLTRPPRDAPGDAGERRLVTVRWGLIPSWSKDLSIGNKLINARAESVAEKPAFRRAFASRRCLLPADGFYEWRGEKKGARQPFYIRPRAGSLAMAGLYEIWRDPTRPDDDPEAFVWSTVVLTTQAVDELGEIHDRMPMLVGRDSWSAWLDPANQNASDLQTMLTPAVPGVLDAYPVSKEVNKVTNNGPQLVEPVTL